MPAKHSVKAKVAKARVGYAPRIHLTGSPDFTVFDGGRTSLQNPVPVAVLPFATAKQARAVVKVHNMTHEERVELVAHAINQEWNPSDGKRDVMEIDRKAARAILSDLHFREGTKE